jgi:hypothetical protein
MEVQELLKQRESEWLDFKRDHHENTAKLLHDILCLANSYNEHDRYVLFGVGDDGSLHGVASDPNRRTSANLQDFLRQVSLNRIPTCRVDTQVVQEHELDVLSIRNRPDKPFFVTRDYDWRGERVRNGVVYTRIGDTNVPLKESAPPDLVELMWRERFGLGLSPLERAERFLSEPERWKKMSEGYLYYVDFPEFTIVDGETMRETFVEEWTTRYPDKTARSFDVQLRYHTTLLERFTSSRATARGTGYRYPSPCRSRTRSGSTFSPSPARPGSSPRSTSSTTRSPIPMRYLVSSWSSSVSWGEIWGGENAREPAAADSPKIFEERDKGFEPSTFSLGS